MKNKGLICFIILVACLITFVSSALYVMKIEKYCGTIIKVTPENSYETGLPGRPNTNHTETDRYVVIKFDNGKTKAINLEPTSYYTAYKGKQVCLNLTSDDYTGEGSPVVGLILLSMVIGVLDLMYMLVKTMEE